MRRVNLENSLIWFPQKNTIYEVNPSGLTDYKTSVIFKGDWEEFAYCDLSSGSFLTKEKLFADKPEEQMHLTPENVFFIPKESLPPGLANNSWTPLLIYLPKSKKLIECKEIIFTFPSINHRVNLNIQVIRSHTLNDCNDIIQKECQLLAKNIPVVVGEHPLFLEKNRPNLQFLENLYQQFLANNNESKLKDEYAMTKGRCHLRAHFVSMLLSQYGIDSFKVYKFWQEDDWNKFATNNHKWKFHCAVMLIDADNKKWIWDPWVGFNKHLLTLDQWLNRKDEPTPIKLLITNKSVLNDIKHGRYEEAANFMQKSSDLFLNKFQYLIKTAIPNPPNTTLFDENPALTSQNPMRLFNRPHNTALGGKQFENFISRLK